MALPDGRSVGTWDVFGAEGVTAEDVAAEAGGAGGRAGAGGAVVPSFISASAALDETASAGLLPWKLLADAMMSNTAKIGARCETLLEGANAIAAPV